MRIKLLNFICLCALVLLVKFGPCDADSQRNDDNNSNSTRSVRSLGRGDPCAPYDPPTPDFSRAGRRISSAKCYEYIWEMKKRSEKSLRQKLCEAEEYRKKNGGLMKPVIQVAGGTRALFGEFPNMGAIGWRAKQGNWVFLCGSSLISPNFVLTAAHCKTAPPKFSKFLVDLVPKIIRLGETSIEDYSYEGELKRNDARIMKIIDHPNYNPQRQYFDIALMQLDRNVKFSSAIQPVCLWSGGDEMQYIKAEIAGWGAVRSGANMSPNLLTATVDIIDSAKCNTSLMSRYCVRAWCGIQDHQICAGKLSGGVDTCQGDSGGPLQVKIPLPIRGEGTMHYLLGVTSFGIGCGLPNLPGVYSRVSSFIDWIEDNVWK